MPKRDQGQSTSLHSALTKDEVNDKFRGGSLKKLQQLLYVSKSEKSAQIRCRKRRSCMDISMSNNYIRSNNEMSPRIENMDYICTFLRILDQHLRDHSPLLEAIFRFSEKITIKSIRLCKTNGCAAISLSFWS